MWRTAHLGTPGDDPLLTAQLLALPHDARAVNEDGGTALHLAALRAKPAMAKLLVQHGAPLHALDRHGRDALAFAAAAAELRDIERYRDTDPLGYTSPLATYFPSQLPRLATPAS